MSDQSGWYSPSPGDFGWVQEGIEIIRVTNDDKILVAGELAETYEEIVEKLRALAPTEEIPTSTSTN